MFAYRVGEPFFSNDPTTDERFNQEFVARYNVRSALIVPLMLKRDLIGFVYVANRPGGFRPRDAQLLEIFAGQAAETIANVFNGTITKWNDDAIAADNEGVELPDTAIAIIHRSDDSGTTTNFTDYLFKASNGAWTTEADGLWPEDGVGQGLEGTSGVIGGITDTAGAIGYADDSAVKDTDLGVVSIGVGDSFNPPTAEGAALVVAASPRAEGRPDVDMAIDIDRTITDEGAYPMLLTSYLIACQSYDDEATATAVKDYLAYVVSTEGQQAAADEVGSAPLESSLQEEAAGIVDKISGP